MSDSGAADRAVTLAEGGRYIEAVDLAIRAARQGDAEAAFTLGIWRIVGSLVRRDLALARELMAQAAGAGHVEAAMIHACFLAAGKGGDADWPGAVAVLSRVASAHPAAAEQLALIAAMPLDGAGDVTSLPEVESLSQSPRVMAVRGFLSPAECDYILGRAEPQFEPSVVVDPRSGRLVPHPIRTSEAMFFGVTQEDPVIKAINRRIAALTGTSTAQGETLQVLRYRPGTEYRPHFDALPGEANQRIATMLLYLTDDYEGGQTHFARTGLSFRGGRGDALYFLNVTDAGELDPQAQHAGLPVTSGVKIIGSRWIRARPISLPVPEPLTGDRFD
jgi:prolyl 4-hydroxylase